jgi:PDZ domain
MTLATTLRRSFRHSLMCSVAGVGVLGLAGTTMAQNPNAQPAPGMGGARPDMDRASPDKAGRPDRDSKHWDKSRDMKDMKAAHNKMLDQVVGFNVMPLARSQASNYENLKPGVGLVVENVTPDSKAAKAGLQNGDVIFQLRDQWVINTPQLCTLLAIQDADDDFEIKVYRGTERVDVDFELDQAALDNMNRMHDEAAMGSMDSGADRSMTRTDAGTPRSDGMRNNDRDDDDLAGVKAGQAGLIIPERFEYKDDQHSFDLSTDDGSKKLTVKDDDGNVLFEGPYNTQAERDAVPADLRAKFEKALRAKVN